MPAGNDNCETHKMKLSAEVLRAGGSIRLKVLGTSMLPSVWPGDIVSIEGGAVAAVARGDIVLYESDDGFFVHRIVETLRTEESLHLVTRGDAVPQNDPIISKPQLLGRVSSIYRGGRTIVPKRQLAPLMRAAGWVLCNSDSLRSLALRVHSFRTRPRTNGFVHLARFF